MQTTWSSFSGNTAATTSAVTTNDTSDTPSTLFTTLLVAQIRNQNPLEPTDPSEFVGQLTQLSQMEALQNLVSQGSVTASMLESLQVLTLGSQVGSRVTVATDSVRVADQQPVEGSFTLSSASGSTAVVLSSGGQTFRVELGARAPGNVDFSFDPAEFGIPDGTYAISVATDSGETPVVGLTGEVQSVRLSGTAGVVLTVAGIGEVASTAITTFNGRSSSATADSDTIDKDSDA